MYLSYTSSVLNFLCHFEKMNFEKDNDKNKENNNKSAIKETFFRFSSTLLLQNKGNKKKKQIIAMDYSKIRKVKK